MGWETDFITRACFNRKTYNSKQELEIDLRDCKGFIKDLEQSLIAMVAANPKDLIEEDCEGNKFDIIESITRRVKQWLEEFTDYYIDKIKLEDALEYWPTRWGDFVKPDMYAKFISNTDSIFIKDAVYEVNKGKTWNGDTIYYIGVSNQEPVFIPFNEENFNKFFISSNEEEYKAYRDKKYKETVEEYIAKMNKKDEKTS